MASAWSIPPEIEFVIAMRTLFLALVLTGTAAAVMAQSTQMAFGDMQRDRSAPVEITAEALSIEQSDGTAVYEGDVLIRQGTMRLSAARVLVVFIADGQRIERLEAEGGVTLVSGEEAAEAARADYNIDAGIITLLGDVLVTRGANAIAAERMVVDLGTGTAQMSGEVRTLFQPAGEDR
jgi:lipopolysaccharide export system protein LptA